MYFQWKSVGHSEGFQTKCEACIFVEMLIWVVTNLFDSKALHCPQKYPKTPLTLQLFVIYWVMILLIFFTHNLYPIKYFRAWHDQKIMYIHHNVRQSFKILLALLLQIQESHFQASSYMQVLQKLQECWFFKERKTTIESVYFKGVVDYDFTF